MARWLVACAAAACALEASAFAPSSGALAGLRRGSAQCSLASPVMNSRRVARGGLLAATGNVDAPARIAELEAVHPSSCSTDFLLIHFDLGEKLRSACFERREANYSFPMACVWAFPRLQA